MSEVCINYIDLFCFLYCFGIVLPFSSCSKVVQTRYCVFYAVSECTYFVIANQSFGESMPFVTDKGYPDCISGD